MIPDGEVVAAVVTALRAAGHPVGVSDIPTVAAGEPWAVVEIPAGGAHPGGFGGDVYAEVAVRVRCVATDPDPSTTGGGEAATTAVLWLADQVRGLLLTPGAVSSPAGWHVAGVTHTGSSGVDREGTAVNAVDDFVVQVVT